MASNVYIIFWGAKGQSYRRNDKNKVKTKAKTVNKNLDKRPQTIAFAKATKTNIQTDRNRDLDEAAPEATSDTERIHGSWRTKNGVYDAIT
jgi:hypothetical protein